MIYDGYDLWERFCIMTVDGNVPDILALKILERKTTPRLYSWLEWKVKGIKKNYQYNHKQMGKKEMENG